MKKITFLSGIIFVLILIFSASACEEAVKIRDCEKLQTATLKATNNSGHTQRCVLNGATALTLEPGETKETTIQTGFYVIEFKYPNGNVCCSEAFFEARACTIYSYSCSH